MGLFHDIQAQVVSEDSSLASILLKLRLLASRLDSEPLAVWVRQELEGYTAGTVPPYRIVNVAYRGTFSGPFGSGVKDAPIPPALIDKVAGKGWTQHEMTESISSIGQLAQGTLKLDCANLILLLQGKVYADYACNEVAGIISAPDLIRILDVVRSKILDFTIEMERTDPTVGEISLDRRSASSDSMAVAANRAVHQTIYAENVTNNAFTFETDLEKIVMDRIVASDGTDREKDRIVDSVKNAGIQEIVKQFVQKSPSLVQFLGTLLP